MRPWRALAALLLCAAALVAPARAQQAVPALVGRVIDQTGTLPAGDRQALNAKLAAFERRKGTQIVVLMVPTTAPEDIAAYANRVANAWKIGRRDVGDGVLVIVAKNDRRMRIEVAKTLEGAVPDLAAARIIDQQMKPAFRSGDFAGGLTAAADQLIARISGEALPEAPSASHKDRGLLDVDWEHLILFLFFGVFIGGPVLRQLMGAILGPLAAGGLGGLLAFGFTGSLVVSGIAGLLALGYTLLARPASFSGSGGPGHGADGWSGGSSSPSSGDWGGGGGFSSGGGGDFGGGGASGDW
ncbi:MAG: TPM domain-containing protein [Xenophilus sp.]